LAQGLFACQVKHLNVEVFVIFLYRHPCIFLEFV
jgi:hypothetical protein